MSVGHLFGQISPTIPKMQILPDFSLSQVIETKAQKKSGMPWAQGVGRSNRPAPTMKID